MDPSWQGSRDSLRDKHSQPPSTPVRREDRGASVASTSPSIVSSGSTIRSSLSQIHKLARMSKLAKHETCSLCCKTMSSFFTHGYKCNLCQIVFHEKCIKQGVNAAQVRIRFISTFSSLTHCCFSLQAIPTNVLDCSPPSMRPNPTSPEPEREPKARKGSRDTVDSTTGVISTGSGESSKWNLQGTSEFTDSNQDVVSNGEQLHRLTEFLARKIQTLDDTKGDADRVFLSALRELRGIRLLYCTWKSNELSLVLSGSFTPIFVRRGLLSRERSVALQLPIDVSRPDVELQQSCGIELS